MGSASNHVRWFLCVAFAIALAGLYACAGVSSPAAPSGGVDTPVAVEIPAVNTISEIAYITGPVVAAVSGDLASKSASSLKVATTDTYGPGSSLNACQTANVTRELLNSGSRADSTICLLKNEIAPDMTTAGIDIYDGNDHDVAIWSSSQGETGLFKMRFNITKNNSDAITQIIMYTCECTDSDCSSSTQSNYTKEVFNSEGSDVTITSKVVETDYSATIAVTGTLNADVQYLSKTVTQSDRQENSGSMGGGDTLSQRALMTQDATTGTVDGFQTINGNTSHAERIYSYLGITYTGDPAADLDLTQYDLGTGAGRYIDDILDQTNCWDENGDVASFPCTPYSDAIQDKTPMEVTDIPAVSFVVGESDYIDCSTVIPEFTRGSELNPVAVETSTCSGFQELDSHMSCYTSTYAIYASFTVTPTINGATLSTDMNNPTRVGTAPTLVITTNYPPQPTMFTTSSVSLAVPPLENILNSSDYETSNWVSAATESTPDAMSLTFQPTLSTATYTLKIESNLSAIDLRQLGTSASYYITP